jgi:hypothetical protein
MRNLPADNDDGLTALTPSERTARASEPYCESYLRRRSFENEGLPMPTPAEREAALRN